jgi:pimeloyl-ACP methyl ester carboxylesterase
MQTVVNGIMTHYEKHGEGPGILFLHGWGDNSLTWQKLSDSLTTTFTTVTVDLPGFGNTSFPTDEVWGLNEYAQFVADFNKKINNEPFAIIGHSNGGAIAVVGIANGLLKAKKLVLLASAGIRNKQKNKKRLLSVSAKIAKISLKPLPNSTQEKIKQKAYKKIGSDKYVAPHLEQTFAKILSQDIELDCAKINQPTLLIYGEQDSATPVEFGKIIASKIANAQLIIEPNAGHFVHHDSINTVSKVIRVFLND